MSAHHLAMGHPQNCTINPILKILLKVLNPIAVKRLTKIIAQMYLQPHYGNRVFGNVYLLGGQH